MALEVVGGAILSSVLNVMLERMASQELMDLLRKKQPIAELLEKLKIMLLSANAVLNDAEDKQIRDENVKNWVDELNDVLLKADDVIDEINTESLRREIEGSHQPRCSMRKILVKLIPVSSVAFDKAIKPKIENVLERLKFVLDQKDYLGLREGVQSKRLERSPAPLIRDPSEVYGRENEKEAIVDLLLSKNINGGDVLSVIPIVGMGGIGKTTLARLIYNDSRVKNHFEHRAWVTVSDDFDVQRLARLVFKELTSKEPTTEELGKLRDNLKVELSGQKFFLVLDDVWNKNYGKWNEFMSYLRYGANGCKIIVTTRNEDTASVMKTGNVQLHSLKTMSDEDCLRLLNKHVSYDVNSDTSQCLKEIVKKCKGLPLAVMSLAGLLRSLSDPKDWNDILESDVWDLHKKGDYEILPSLWLSYSYLPPHVKRCFAYCSIFPKDYKYKREEMIWLWMAEGLLEGENMKEVGGKCLNMLISRSLLQRSSEDETVLLMHDLVHDLAMFVIGKGYCAMLDDVNVKSITNKTRHVLFKYKAPDTESFKDLTKAECLRTFLYLAPRYRPLEECNNNADVLIKKFGCLRVLCPLTTSILEVPDSIGNLKHLRYLNLSWTKIKRLPDTICTLYNLQTLLLCYCELLTRLPGNIDRLINLRHLDISETDSLETVPPGIFNLKSLHITLSRLVLSGKRSGSIIKELGKRLHWRGRLQISRLENVVDVNDVLEAEFKNISSITDLSLHWSYRDACDSQKEREVLDALRPHHANLKTLEVCDYRGKQLSDWVVDLTFSHTTEVSLFNCTECCYLPPFGQLPSLKKLEIKGFDSIETISSEFYGSADSTPFISLETLNFGHMFNWRCWSLDGDNELEAGAFPCLKELTLHNCPKLNSPLPHCIPSLRELKISECDQMEALLPSGQLMNTAFPSVETIELIDCPELECMGWPFPASLHELSLSYSCGKLWEQHMHWGLQALEEMRIKQCVDLFPEEGLLPATLVSLWIRGGPHLKALNGKGFQQLTCLEKLFICGCPVLQCLPEEGLPASLSILQVWGCPLLEPRLEKEKGEDWHKISHIRHIYVL